MARKANRENCFRSIKDTFEFPFIEGVGVTAEGLKHILDNEVAVVSFVGAFPGTVTFDRSTVGLE